MTNYRAFTINTIAHDLHREEAICQIAQSLEFLDNTCNEIFKRINDSIENARVKIKSFDARINLIDVKINKIRGSNKAIQICSSANYPIPNMDEEYFPSGNAKDPDDFYDSIKFYDYKSRINKMWKHLYHTSKPIEMKHKINKYTTPYTQLDDLSFKEKFQEYMVDNVLKFDSRGASDSSSNPDGLGSVLNNQINSVTSLLLFNTAQHVYKQSDLKDPLADLDKKKKNIYDLNDRMDLYEAPQTILKGYFSFNLALIYYKFVRPAIYIFYSLNYD